MVSCITDIVINTNSVRSGLRLEHRWGLCWRSASALTRLLWCSGVVHMRAVCGNGGGCCHAWWCRLIYPRACDVLHGCVVLCGRGLLRCSRCPQGPPIRSKRACRVCRVCCCISGWRRSCAHPFDRSAMPLLLWLLSSIAAAAVVVVGTATGSAVIVATFCIAAGAYFSAIHVAALTCCQKRTL